MDNEEIGMGKGGLNIAHLNVASLLGAHKFEMMRKQLELSQLHIFGASETWLNSNIPNELVAVSGYKFARLDRGWSDNRTNKEPKKGGGLICYVDEGLEMNEFRYATLNCSCSDLEMQWVSLEATNMRRVVIINIIISATAGGL